MGYQFWKNQKVLGRIFRTMYWFPRPLDLFHYLEKLCRQICQKENGVFTRTTKERIKIIKTKVKTQIEKRA